MYFHIRVEKVEALEGTQLLVTFIDGQTCVYEVQQLFDDLPHLTVLAEDRQLFKAVKVDVKGHAVYWNDELDIPAYELWRHGEPI